jgi:carbamate kinase
LQERQQFMGTLAVVAIGGNSITKAGQRGTIPEQFANAKETSRHIADMIARGYDVVVTHGNGPQVGNILLRAELATTVLPPLPLDTCGADSQGGMGYMIQQVLGAELRARGVDRTVVTVVTQTVVDRADPAFASPSKPIGPFYTQEEAERKELEEGWNVVEDANRGWRRVVPSPMPTSVVEADAIKALLAAGCARLLANDIGADLLIISTDVERVALNFGAENQTWLRELTVDSARRYHEEGHFPAGSMGPKILAGVAFIEGGGDEVIITNPESIGRALDGETGTRITRQVSGA